MVRIPEPGEHFGRYRIERQIGAGGMGMVFAAFDETMQRQVAVKVLSGHLAGSPEFLDRFHREAAVLARLDSPHAVAVFDTGEIDRLPYIVTQLVAGGDLSQLLATRGPLPVPMAARVCAQVCEALDDAHRVGIVHRDVKPSNVLLRDPDSTRPFAYLCDFGIAAVDRDGLTTPGQIAGSWAYLAPERVQGAPATAASDLYSVGCLLWALVVGRPPFFGTDAQQAHAHVTSPVPQLEARSAAAVRLNQVLTRVLAKDPAHRPATARDLGEELLALADLDRPGHASGASAPPPLRPRQGRRRGPWLAAAAVVTALVLVGGGVVAWQVLGDDDPASRQGQGGGEESEDPPPEEEPLSASERAEIRASASTALLAAVRRSADSYDADVEAATALMSADYGAEFLAEADRDRDDFVAAGTTVTARDEGAGVVTADRQEATLLSYVVQTRRGAGGSGTSTDVAYALRMVQEDGRWLLDDLDDSPNRATDADPDPEIAEILADGSAGAEAYLNLDYRDLDAFVEALRPVSTDTFIESIESDAGGLQAGYRSTEARYTASTLMTGLRTLRGDRAIVLCALEGTYATTSTGGVDTDARFFMRLKLDQVEDGEWLIRRITFV